MADPRDHAERCVTKSKDAFRRQEVVEIVATAIHDERMDCAKVAETQGAGAGEIVNVIAAQIRAR